MAELTTASPLSDFDSDLHRFASKLEYTADELSKRHRQVAHNGTWTRPNSMDNYGTDIESFMTAFSILVSNLRMILIKISELEEFADALDEEDDVELAHTNGEIFALKSLYLTLKKSHRQVEEVRLIAAERRVPARRFYQEATTTGIPSLNRLLRSGEVLVDGTITKPQLYAKTVTTNKITLNNPSPWAIGKNVFTPPPMPPAFAANP